MHIIVSGVVEKCSRQISGVTRRVVPGMKKPLPEVLKKEQRFPNSMDHIIRISSGISLGITIFTYIFRYIIVS